MEVATDEPNNPIKQDIKKGALRQYPFQSLVNYGFVIDHLLLLLLLLFYYMSQVHIYIIMYIDACLRHGKIQQKKTRGADYLVTMTQLMYAKLAKK